MRVLGLVLAAAALAAGCNEGGYNSQFCKDRRAELNDMIVVFEAQLRLSASLGGGEPDPRLVSALNAKIREFKSENGDCFKSDSF